MGAARAGAADLRQSALTGLHAVAGRVDVVVEL